MISIFQYSPSSFLTIKRVLGLIVLYSMMLSSSLSAAINNNEDAQLINDNWQYLEVAANSPEEALAIEGWQQVSLPHTWNATDTVDSTPGYRRNASWYRRTLSSDSAIGRDKRAILYFEGANLETEVYVNGKLAGEHIGGYLGFEIEITDFLKPRRENELMVRVSNRYNPNLVPSQKADFFIHGGITRDLWLKTPPNDYISRVIIDTPQVSAEVASTSVTVATKLSSSGSQKINLVASLLAPNGEEVSRTESSFDVTGGEIDAKLALPKLPTPALWSIDTPNLYTLKASLIDENGKQLHSASERFGYRWFEMRPHKGFFLNGERVLIRGTHRHEEHAGLGAALLNEQHRRDMTMIKNMGANFVLSLIHI